MRYAARILVNEVMDRAQVLVLVHGFPDDLQDEQVLLLRRYIDTGPEPGTDHERWLRDVLVEIAETL